MPIDYTVAGGGHMIHAVARTPVSGEEFVNYEIAHAMDERIKPPVSELFEIEDGALRGVTKDDVLKVIEGRKRVKRKHISHRCGIVVTGSDTRSWDLAKFYEGMTQLHSPEVVIVFGDRSTARTWLGM